MQVSSSALYVVQAAVQQSPVAAQQHAAPLIQMLVRSNPSLPVAKVPCRQTATALSLTTRAPASRAVHHATVALI